MEIKKLHKLVDHWYIRIYIPDDKFPTIFNREIRNWLAINIGSGTWETKCEVEYVGVYFDMDAEGDAMAFKLAWI